ncbi:MAG: polysaccharide pyruvyl transferase family protein [Candidatus Omnitrophica bacterium]|nr:polysaccharide pyruvyl transferase family protein [Candidatus Omnitrophota bacterium]
MRLFFECEQVLEFLRDTLAGAAGGASRAVFLDLPNHRNAGDYFIALGTLFYFRNFLKAQVEYCATAASFSQESLDCAEEAPIFLQGGGNLGDLWPASENFRRSVIGRNPHRRIIVLPQSIYFKDRRELETSCRIYNAHPDLTLCVRESESFRFAEEHFGRCRLILAPDMAFFLCSRLRPLSKNYQPAKGGLFLSRQDQEKVDLFEPPGRWDGWRTENWESYADVPLWGSGGRPEPLFAFPQPPGLPLEWTDRAWSVVRRSARQLLSPSFVVTDRLHGHLMALMLNIPHFFLPNQYHKNESFFGTWTRGILHGCFVKEPEALKHVPRYPLVSLPKNPAPSPRASVPGLKISYCTPCMGRLHHLKKTILRNLRDNERWPAVEFLLLNYGSDAAVEKWAERHLKKWISAGRVKYCRTEFYPHYHMAHAKNVSHLLASGDIVCNLDADNFTGKDFTPFLRDLFQGGRWGLVHSHWKLRRQSMGRLAMRKEDWMDLGGYDESFTGWGSEDRDLMFRAIDAGIQRFLVPDWRLLKNVLHGDDERVRFFKAEDRDTEKTKRANSERLLGRVLSGDLRANRSASWGQAKVYLNFSPTAIDVGHPPSQTHSD